MKKLFSVFVLSMIIGFSSMAFADHWIACNTQEADGFLYSLDGSAWVETFYQEIQATDGNTYAVIANIESVAAGPHDIEVKAFIDDAIWGRLESSIVPFDFVKPDAGGGTYGIPAPTGIRVVEDVLSQQ